MRLLVALALLGGAAPAMAANQARLDEGVGIARVQAQAGEANPPGVRYFGYFDSAADWVGAGNYTSLVADHSNVTWIASSAATMTDFTNWHTARLAEAQSLDMRAIIDVAQIFFQCVPNQSCELRGDYPARWQSYSAAIRPYLGSIAAFYLLDEPYAKRRMNKISMRNDLNTVSLAIKTAFKETPDSFMNVPTAVIFDYDSIQDDGLRGPPPAGPSVPNQAYPSFTEAGLPDRVDWVGVDCYYNGGTFEACGGQSLPWYVNRLKHSMTPAQRLMLIPQASVFGTFHNHDAALTYQPALRCRIEKEIAMALADPSFVGIFAFTYQSFYKAWSPASVEDWTGAQDLPLVKQQYAQIGNAIVHGAPRRSYPCGIAVPGSAAGSRKELLDDGDAATAWNAGMVASPTRPITVVLDLGERTTVANIRLHVSQSPEGETTHAIYGGPAPTAMKIIGQISSYTRDGDWLEFAAEFPNVRYLWIATTASPSWVAWREIEIYRKNPPARVYPLPIRAGADEAAGGYADSMLFSADGLESTFWNSGGPPIRWIDYDLGQTVTLRTLRLRSCDSAGGAMTHEVYASPALNFGSANAAPPIHTFTGPPPGGPGWLELNGAFRDVRYLRIRTTAGNSWVAWCEIEAYR